MTEKATTEAVEDGNLDQIDETSAADTLKPGAGSSGTESKSEMLATFTALLAQLGKEDLSYLYNRTVEQIGKEASALPSGANAAANKASIATKASVKEDIEEMFSGDDLSEDFREKASTVFEAAVNSRTILEEARLQEEFEAAVAEMQEEFDANLQEQAASIFEEVTGKVNDYLEYAVGEWMAENAIAIENSLRLEIAEDFMKSLHNVFAEHYITVPEEKIDLVAELRAELDEVKGHLNEAIDNNIALQAVADEATRASTLEAVSEGLAVTQAEKLRTLAEGIEFTDAATFQRKLEIVKENYFSAKKAPASTGLITESIDGSDEVDATAVIPAGMQRYVSAISKSAK